GSLLAGIAGHVPVGRRHLVEHHPHRLARQLAHVGDRVGYPAGDLVLAVLAVTFVDRDVDEWHRCPPSVSPGGILAEPPARQARPICPWMARAKGLNGDSSSATIEKGVSPVMSSVSPGPLWARHTATSSAVCRWYSGPSSPPSVRMSGVALVGAS